MATIERTYKCYRETEASMEVLDAIEAMLAESGETKAGLASSLGRSRQSIYNMYQKRTDVKCATLLAMAEHMGYELVLRKGEDEISLSAAQ